MRGRKGPERHFAVVAGKVLAEETATRFALVREGTGSARPRVEQAMIQAGCTDGAPVTVLSDGDAGLRAMPREVAAKSEHSLDWLPLAIRFQHVMQVARGLSHDPIRTLAKRWVTGRMDRAKWCLWNGKAVQDGLTPTRPRGAPGTYTLQHGAAGSAAVSKREPGLLTELGQALSSRAADFDGLG